MLHREGIILVASLGLMGVVVTGCGGDSPTGATVPVVTTIEVTPSALTLNSLGPGPTLSAVAFDQFGTPITTSFTWVSTNPGVATISTAGLVTALDVGSTTILVTASGVAGAAAIEVDLGPTDVVVTSGSIVDNGPFIGFTLTLVMENLGNPGQFTIRVLGNPTQPNGPLTLLGESAPFSVGAGWSETLSFDVVGDFLPRIRVVEVWSQTLGDSTYRLTSRLVTMTISPATTDSVDAHAHRLAASFGLDP